MNNACQQCGYSVPDKEMILFGRHMRCVSRLPKGTSPPVARKNELGGRNAYADDRGRSPGQAEKMGTTRS